MCVYTHHLVESRHTLHSQARSFHHHHHPPPPHLQTAVRREDGVCMSVVLFCIIQVGRKLLIRSAVQTYKRINLASPKFKKKKHNLLLSLPSIQSYYRSSHLSLLSAHSAVASTINQSINQSLSFINPFHIYQHPSSTSPLPPLFCYPFLQPLFFVFVLQKTRLGCRPC